MIIDPEKCVACGSCVIYCPLGAIKIKDVAEINKDKCVECGDCIRANVCPADAFSDPQLPMPRAFRNNFSNPLTEHPETRVPGRGTEEMKTNDIRGLFGGDKVGIAMELGRPGVSTSMVDVEKVAMAVAGIPGIAFADKNPVTANMKSLKTGELKEDIKGERMMSAIVEIEVPRASIGAVFDAIKKVSTQIDTVFSLDIIDRPLKDHTMPIKKIVDEKGIAVYPNGKFNYGLARPLVP